MEQLELEEFVRYTKELLLTDEVQSMAQWSHHGSVSCLDHSLFVAFTSFCLAKKWGLDVEAVARGGLLHDLYLYHKRDRSAHTGLQCFDHPRIAAENSEKITSLSAKEKNIILAHMWPCGGEMPKSREAFLVNWVDTGCAVVEFVKGYDPEAVRKAIYGALPQHSG